MIIKIIKIDFPNELWREVEIKLNQYGSQAWHNEIDRVRMAILKISNGDIIELQKCIEIACVDYRDVLAYAEYPNEMKLGNSDDVKLITLAKKNDKIQLEQWVAKYR